MPRKDGKKRPKGEPPKPSGGQEKEIDGEMVKRLAGVMCTTDEIAAVLDCSRDTIERRFMPELEAGRLKGRASLRRLQWKAAEGNPNRYDPKGRLLEVESKGNIAMQIWLGKQFLEQSEPEHGTERQDPRRDGPKVRGVVLEGIEPHDLGPDPTAN